MNRSLVLIAAFATLPAGCTTPPKECMPVATPGGLGITIDPSLAPGPYRLVVVAGPEILGLDLEVTPPGTTTCTRCGEVGLEFKLYRDPLSVDTEPFHAYVSTLGVDELGPDHAFVRLFDGAAGQIVEREVSPVYTSTEPDGPGCGVTESAEMTLSP